MADYAAEASGAVSAARAAVDRAWRMAEKTASSKSTTSDDLFKSALAGLGGAPEAPQVDFAFELDTEIPELEWPEFEKLEADRLEFDPEANNPGAGGSLPTVSMSPASLSFTPKAAMGATGLPQPGSAGTRMTPANFDFDVRVTEPDVLIPREAEGASFEVFEAWTTRLSDDLAARFAWFIDKYFPNECNYLGKAQQWICKTLTEGGTGMAPHVEEQIWQRDRSRVLNDIKRAKGDMLATFAARGFPLPPGSVAGAMLQLENEALDKIAQASRDVAIKQAEIEIENVKFAVEKAIDLYSAAVGAAGDFIKALAGTHGNMTQLIPSITDSQAKLISAASQYYQSRISVEELRLKATMPESEWQQEANAKNLEIAMQLYGKKADVALETYRTDLAKDEVSLKAAMPNGEWQQQAGAKNLEAAVQLATATVGVSGDLYRTDVAKDELSLKAKISDLEMQLRVAEKNADIQLQYATAKAQAELDIYKGELATEEMRLKAALPDGEWEMRTNEKNLDAKLAIIRAKVDAAVAAAQSLGTQASAALNGLHASASITGNGSAQLGTSFSENWTKDITS